MTAPHCHNGSFRYVQARLGLGGLASHGGPGHSSVSIISQFHKFFNLFFGGFLPLSPTVWRRHSGGAGNIRLSGKPSWLGGLIGWWSESVSTTYRPWYTYFAAFAIKRGQQQQRIFEGQIAVLYTYGANRWPSQVPMTPFSIPSFQTRWNIFKSSGDNLICWAGSAIGFE